MIKNECEIVKDLIPNYLEDALNNGTKEFIEEHIKSCNNCKRILKEAEKEKNGEDNKKDENEKHEIDYLKKYNRKIRLLQVIAGILVVIILAIWSVMLAKYIQYRKDYEIGEYNHSIIEQVCNKIQEVKDSKNYIYSVFSNNTTTNPLTVLYVQDGKFKKEVYDKDNAILSTTYGVDLDTNMYAGNIDVLKNFYCAVQFSKDYPNGNTYLQSKSFTTKPITLDEYSYHYIHFLYNYYNLETIKCASLKITEDIIDDKECYVISEDAYNYLCVDKQTMLPIKEEEKLMKSDGTVENMTYWYTCKLGEVKDSDVEADKSLLDSDKLNGDFKKVVKEQILSRY